MNFINRKLCLKWLRSVMIRTPVSIHRFYSSENEPLKLAYDLIHGKDANLPPLLIMHGLLGSRRNWRGVSKIYILDARNHGDSGWNDDHKSENMADDVVVFMDLHKIKKAVVMGHSMGGRTMMYMALKYPQLVEKAIIVDISPTNVPRDLQEMKGLLLAMQNASVPLNTPTAEARKLVEKQLYEKIGDNGTVSFIMLNFEKLKDGKYGWKPNLTALQNNLKFFDNFLEQIASFQPYQGPTLFIGGKHSNFIDEKDWPAIQKIFPNSSLTWLETGHLVHFEEPDKFTDLVAEFVKK